MEYVSQPYRSCSNNYLLCALFLLCISSLNLSRFSFLELLFLMPISACLRPYFSYVLVQTLLVTVLYEVKLSFFSLSL